MVVDIGEVKRHIKPKADSTLRNMRKDDLIKCIRCLEHNYDAAVSFNENQARYVESLGVLLGWIPVSERLPEEHDSMFAKWYGTPLWQPGMFRTTSGDVLVCVEFGEGSRVVSTARTNAGEWNISSIFSGKVTHWMPLPEPPKEVRDGKT